MLDWAIMTDRGPVYDGVGPRTSATGASLIRKPDDMTSKMTSIPELDERQHHLMLANAARDQYYNTIFA